MDPKLLENLRKRYGIPKTVGKVTGYDLSRHPLIEQALVALASLIKKESV